jgi:hypothetical protein
METMDSKSCACVLKFEIWSLLVILFAWHPDDWKGPNFKLKYTNIGYYICNDKKKLYFMQSIQRYQETLSDKLKINHFIFQKFCTNSDVIQDGTFEISSKWYKIKFHTFLTSVLNRSIGHLYPWGKRTWSLIGWEILVMIVK